MADNPNTILLGGDDAIMGVYDFNESFQSFVPRLKDKR